MYIKHKKRQYSTLFTNNLLLIYNYSKSDNSINYLISISNHSARSEIMHKSHKICTTQFIVFQT